MINAPLFSDKENTDDGDGFKPNPAPNPDAYGTKESIIEGEITEENAIRKINELGEIADKIKELNNQKKVIENYLRAYSEATDSIQLDGSEYSARFDKTEVLRVPKKGSSQRSELEMKLIELDLWEQVTVTALYARGLKNKLKSDEWSPQEITAIEKYMLSKEAFKVKLTAITKPLPSSDGLVTDSKNEVEAIKKLPKDSDSPGREEYTENAIPPLAITYYKRAWKEGSPADHKYFNKAIQVDPNDFTICEMIGSRLRNKQRHAEACPFLETALDRAPEDEKDRLQKLIDECNDFLAGSRADPTLLPKNRRLKDPWKDGQCRG